MHLKRDNYFAVCGQLVGGLKTPMAHSDIFKTSPHKCLDCLFHLLNEKFPDQAPVSRAIYQVTFNNGEIWNIPLVLIANSRSSAHKMDLEDPKQVLAEMTAHHYEASGWARNNMHWSDIRDYAFKTADAETPNFEEEWANPRTVAIV